MIVTRVCMILWLSLAIALTLPLSDAIGQNYPAVEGRQFMLNQMTPPGVAGEWAVKLGRACPEWFQPVRLTLPSTGMVTFYEGSPERFYDVAAPAQAGLLVGRLYRLRVSDVPEFPGVEFFPSIELIDRLHPPVGKADEFPVEFELTVEELEWATNGRLVTKVIYLEQPNRVPAHLLEPKERITTVEPFKNAVAEADLLGRPIAIVRLGGRTPDLRSPDPAFFGPGGPIRVSQVVGQTQMKSSGQGDSNQPGVFKVRQSSRKVAQR